MTHVSVLSPTVSTPATLATNGRHRRTIHHILVTASATGTLTVTLNEDTVWTLKLANATQVIPFASTPYRSLEFSTDTNCTVVAFTTLDA